MIVEPSAANLDRAAELLRAGELVGMPTETVYGLAADARSPQAVARIFAAKGRPADHPLIVHLPDVAQLGRWAREIPEHAWQLAETLWPGPLTLILRRTADVPDAVTGGQDTVGLRIPQHPVALALLRRFGSGLAAPSANRFGRISPTTAADVEEELGDRVALILDGGPCTVGIESTILDLSRERPVILRPGAITAARIGELIGVEPDLAASPGARDESKAPRVSGSLAAHYAPRTPMRLCAPAELVSAARMLAGGGQPVSVLARTCADPCVAGVCWNPAPETAEGFAHDLYANLRRLDRQGVALILVEAPPAGDAWRAVGDRLARAETGSGAGSSGS